MPSASCALGDGDGAAEQGPGMAGTWERAAAPSVVPRSRAPMGMALTLKDSDPDTPLKEQTPRREHRDF